jgi:hypothetical protein
MEKQLVQNSEEIQIIFKALKQLLNPSQEPIKRIGFKISGSSNLQNDGKA